MPLSSGPNGGAPFKIIMYVQLFIISKKVDKLITRPFVDLSPFNKENKNGKRGGRG